MIACLSAAALAATSAPPADDPAFAASPATEVWAGEQITVGVRHAPILGDIRTITTVRTLARVARDGDAIILVDRPCAILLDSDGGVGVSFPDAAMTSMPAATSTWARVGDAWTAEPWAAGWGSDDVDADGEPGVRLRIRAPVCGGWMALASRTSSAAQAVVRDGGLVGQVEVSIARDVLDVSNPCLGLLAKHSEEQVSGRFAFVPVAADATCEDLAAAGWPVTATQP